MKRFTIMTPYGAALKMDDTYPNEGAARADLMEKYRLAVDRLAAYEDTGLEPEEIARERFLIAARKDPEKLARLRDLVFADAQGRVEILPPNISLTLEELREMDGVPVWLQARGLCRYDILTGFAINGLAQFYTAALPSETYGKTWLAYRRKPEEGDASGV